MLNDFEIITRHFPENNDIKIYPISDVHLGAAEHLTAEWDNFCKRILEEPNSYVILGGDLLNNSTRSSVVSMTSWLAYGGYAARAMLTPSSYVPQEIILRGNRKEMKVIM